MADWKYQYIKSPVAFCLLHQTWMNVKRIKMSKCLNKHCKHLSKIKHPWWEERERKKINKQLKK